jgi:hypothetical protein
MFRSVKLEQSSTFEPAVLSHRLSAVLFRHIQEAEGLSCV